MIYTGVYFFIFMLFVIDFYLFFRFAEYIYCAFIIKQPPNVTSSKYMMQKVVEQINTFYGGAKNICDIGSGFGFMTRFVSKHTKSYVIGLENSMFSAFVSKILDTFCFCKIKTIRCDAYKYLENIKNPFDVCIAYLGPKEVQNLKKYKSKMRVLICLDFEINMLKPKRVIDIGHGCTRFNNKLYPHKLFIYEFK